MTSPESDLSSSTGAQTTSEPIRPASAAVAAPARFRPPLFLPVLAVSVLSLVCRFTDFDLSVAASFHDHYGLSWPYERVYPWYGIYTWGLAPTIALAVLGFVWFLFYPPQEGKLASRWSGFYVLLVLLIGPTLLVNVGFKNSFGRPRPIEVDHFGGERPFLALGTPDFTGKHNSSFPSGHAAAAFALMAPGFAVYAHDRRRGQLLIAAAFAYGVAMSVTRIVQGGHFFSDCLWSFAMVYATCYLLAEVTVWRELTNSSDPEA